MSQAANVSNKNTTIVVLVIALIIALSAVAYFYLQTRQLKTAEPVEVSINNADAPVAPKHEVSLIQASEVVANLPEVKEIRNQVEKDPKHEQHLALRNAKDFTVNIDDKKYWTIEVGVTSGDKFELRDTYYVGVHDAEIMLYDIGSDKIIKLSEQRKIND